ncbi:MAG: hypothetical protein R2711_19025 [Acidimicrobiales bacterium]
MLAHPALDGTCPTLWRDLDATAASLDDLHPGDGDGWRSSCGGGTSWSPT